MIGAIAGDIIGSVYEFDNIKTTVFPFFTRKSNYTDDTIMTVAVTDWLLYGGNLVQVMHRYGREFPCPMGGYGARFGQWLCETNPQPYNSLGNGSAMRVSAVGWAFGSLEKTLQVAEETAAVSHNHPEGIKGAQAVAAAIYLARTGKSKQAIREYIETTFLYDLNFSICYSLPVTRSGRTIALTQVVRELSRRRLSLFWKVRILKLQSVWPFLSVAIQTRWPALREE